MNPAEKKTVSIAKANLFGFLITFPFLAVYMILYYLTNYTEETLPNLSLSIRYAIENYGGFVYSGVLLGIVILGIAIHELIHGLC